MKLVFKPAVLATPLAGADALRPAVLAAFLLASSALIAAPKQDPAAMAQALFPAPRVTLVTPGYAQHRFTTYEEIADFIKPIGPRPGVQLDSLLRTQQGREVWAVKLLNPRARVRVMIISRVHGNEPAASEGALQLLSSLIGGELKGQYDAVELVIVPMANPDGSSANDRSTAAGGDINRDFIKGEFAETRALQAEIRRFDPHIVLDAHEHTVWGRLGERTIAADIMSTGPNEPNLPAALRDVTERMFRGAIDAILTQAGLRHQLYELLSLDKKTGALQVAESATTFFSSKNFHAMGGRISMLIEGRGIGLGDQHMARRSQSQYLAMKAVVQTAQGQADAVVAALESSRAQIRDLKTWELDRLPVKQQRDFQLADSVTNTVVTVPAEFTNRSDGRKGPTIEVPRHYIVPQSQKTVIEMLERFGVMIRTLDKPLTATVGVQSADFRGASGYLKVESKTVEAERSFAAGDYLIDTRQRSALYLQVLEAASPNSLARLGVFGRADGTELPVYRYNGAP